MHHFSLFMKLQLSGLYNFSQLMGNIKVLFIRNVVAGCIEKGGVATLYAGWRAVLCRNIPHSIIKVHIFNCVPFPLKLFF